MMAAVRMATNSRPSVSEVAGRIDPTYLVARLPPQVDGYGDVRDSGFGAGLHSDLITSGERQFVSRRSTIEHQGQ